MLEIDDRLTQRDVARVTRELNRMLTGLDNTKQALHLVSLMLRAKFSYTIKAGTDPTGKPLAPVAIWTRRAGIGRGIKGNATPLLNTQAMFRDMGAQKLTNQELVFGFRGKQLRKARRMINGTPGLMLVRDARIKGEYSGIRKAKKDGHRYIRAKMAQGWRTKQVQGRNQIRIKPRKRNFFFLTRQMVNESVETVADWVAKQAA